MKIAAIVLAMACTAMPPPATAQFPVVGPLPRWQPRPHGDLAVEASDFLSHTAYSKPDKAANRVAPDGAYGPLNMGWDHDTGGRWLIEEQRYGFDAVVAGLIYHRQDLADRGEAIFD